MSVIARTIHSELSTGAAALATTIAPGRAWKLVDIRIHLSAAGASGTFTATLDHSGGSEYDLVVLTQAMTSIVDLSLSDSGFVPMPFDANTELDIAWANANTKTWGLEVIWQEM